MALRTAKQWSTWMDSLEFSDTEKSQYSSALANEAITENDLPEFNHELLQLCNVCKYGHRTRLIRKARGSSRPADQKMATLGSTKVCKIPRPSIAKGATQLEFEQFIYEWKQFKKHYNFHDEIEIETQLTFCCPKDIRGKICEIRQPETVCGEEELLTIIKDLCLSKVSRMTHIQKFHTMKQEVSESCEDYCSRLHTMATCCKFECMHCGKSNNKERVREKFVLGIRERKFQTAILRTVTYHPNTPLEKLLEEATTLEQSVREQQTISNNVDTTIETVHGLENTISDDDESVDQLSANLLKFRQKNNYRKQFPKKSFPQCPRCGTTTHAVYTTSERCAAWGKNL